MSSDAGPHPSSTAHALEVMVKRARAMGREPQAYPAGSRVLGEGDANHSLYVLLKGEVLLSKTGRDQQPMELDHLGPGDLLGILSFWTGKPSFSDSHALTDMECLVIDQEQFDQGVADDPEFTRVTLQLLVANLSNR